MILAGGLQFQQFQKRGLRKNQASTESEPMSPTYPLDATTNWATKPQATGKARQISDFKETYSKGIHLLVVFLWVWVTLKSTLFSFQKTDY